MTISVVSGQNAGTQTSTSSASTTISAPSNVASGNTAIVCVGCFSTNTLTFTAAGLTKSAGTATIGAPALAVQNDFLGGDGHYAAAVFYVPITGSGSLTLQVSSGDAGTYWIISFSEVSSSAALSTEASNGVGVNSSATTVDSGNATSAGAALFVGSMAAGTAGTTFTIDSAWTEIHQNAASNGAMSGGMGYRNVLSGTTDSCTYTIGAASGQGYSIVVAALKESGGGTTNPQTVAITSAGTVSASKRSGKIASLAATAATSIVRSIGAGLSAAAGIAVSLTTSSAGSFSQTVSIAAASTASLFRSMGTALGITSTASVVLSAIKATILSITVNSLASGTMSTAAGKVIGASAGIAASFAGLVNKGVSVASSLAVSFSTGGITSAVINIAGSAVVSVSRAIGKTSGIISSAGMSFTRRIAHSISVAATTAASLAGGTPKTIVIAVSAAVSWFANLLGSTPIAVNRIAYTTSQTRSVSAPAETCSASVAAEDRTVAVRKSDRSVSI